MDKRIFFLLMLFLSFQLNKCVVLDGYDDDHDDHSDDDEDDDHHGYSTEESDDEVYGETFGEASCETDSEVNLEADYETDYEAKNCYDTDDEEEVDDWDTSSPLILEGRKIDRVSTEQIPYVAFIKLEPNSGFPEKDKISECQGTAVSDRLILTAKNCAHMRNPNEIRVYIRANDHSNIDREIGYSVYKIDDPPDKGDIAILYLNEKIKISGFHHIHIPTMDVRSGDILSVVGSGYSLSPPFGPNDGILHKVQIEVLPDTDCFETFKDSGVHFDAEYMFCARNAYDHKAVTGRGDIGMGAFSGKYLYGVAADIFIKADDQSEVGRINETQPSVFTRVHKYSNWIRGHKHNLLSKTWTDLTRAFSWKGRDKHRG